MDAARQVVREFADSEGHLKVVRESVFDYRDSYGAHGYPDVDLGGADQAHGEHRHPAWLPDRPPWPDCRPPMTAIAVRPPTVVGSLGEWGDLSPSSFAIEGGPDTASAGKYTPPPCFKGTRFYRGETPP